MHLKAKDLVSNEKQEIYKKGDDELNKMINIAKKIGYIKICSICNLPHYCGSEIELSNKKKEFTVSQVCQEALKSNPTLILLFFQSIKTNFSCSNIEN